MRVMIDNEIRCSFWYHIEVHANFLQKISNLPEKLDKPEIRILGKKLHNFENVSAFDIETMKAPLKFPDAQIDSIMMISYMVDGLGFLIINRDVKNPKKTSLNPPNPVTHSLTYSPNPPYLDSIRRHLRLRIHA
jgi:DNA polymerase elongation subunit (family B)